MKIAVICFTGQGRKRALFLQKNWEMPQDILLYTTGQKSGWDRQKRQAEQQEFCIWTEGVAAWAKEQFAKRYALLFIGACGIAVRAIAPVLQDKLTDSPVLVMDELGNYVIPLLSGHVGGANVLAGHVADVIGAVCVVTTATDLEKRFAVDLFAEKNGLCIGSRQGIAAVSSRILRGQTVTVWMEDTISADTKQLPQGLELIQKWHTEPPDIVIAEDEEKRQQAKLLALKPKSYLLGVGCRRGKSMEELDAFIREVLEDAQIEIDDLWQIASIDRKADEPGICQWAEQERIPFVTFPADRLRQVEGDFCASGFVQNTVGVDNVCERAAVLACGKGGILIRKKQARNGMTLALAKRTVCLDFKGGWN